MDPQEEYRSRRQRHAAALEAWELQYRRIGTARLLVFVLLIAAAVAVFDREILSPLFVAVPLLGFFALMVWHRRVEDRRARSRRGLAFYAEGLARLKDQWRGQGPTGQAFAPAEHAFAADLGLFGTGSLFQALCRATTPYGGRALADWLLAPAAAPAIRARQEAVAELAPALDAREAIALAAGRAGSEFHEGALLRWCSGASDSGLARERWISLGLLGGVLAAAWLWADGVIGGIWMLVFVLLQGMLIRRARARCGASIHAGDEALAELADLEAIIDEMDAAPFHAPLLVELASTLARGEKSARPALASLRRRFDLFESGHNLFFAPLAFVIGWEIHTMAAVEDWRARFGASAEQWLAALGDFEALLSLACRAFEQPAEIFPEISEGAPQFVARGLAHPLLPAAEAVGNDIALGGEAALLLVSGSNMSGKSTLLRTVGASAVLAQAGGTVRATALSLSPLSIGASIRTEDSLLDHRSRFQAEIERLALLLADADGERPLLFLLDELLAGTNSHDRSIGASAVLRGFLARGAIGAATTHDLALTAIVDQESARARNVHFEDRFEGDRLVFDYRLREGIVTRSNALDLMRAVGLPVA